MEKSIEDNKKITEKYPFLKPRSEDYDYTWTELDLVCLGWQGIFLEACDLILQHLKEVNVDPEEFEFFDIKEKYGELRISTGGYCDKEIDRIISDLEVRSLLYCPSCGKPSKCVSKGYILFLCPECAAQCKLSYDWLTNKDRPIIKEYNNDGTFKEKPTKYDAEFLAQWNAPSPEGPEVH